MGLGFLLVYKDDRLGWNMVYCYGGDLFCWQAWLYMMHDLGRIWHSYLISLRLALSSQDKHGVFLNVCTWRRAIDIQVYFPVREKAGCAVNIHGRKCARDLASIEVILYALNEISVLGERLNYASFY